jgi:hypothetical protein
MRKKHTVDESTVSTALRIAQARAGTGTVPSNYHRNRDAVGLARSIMRTKGRPRQWLIEEIQRARLVDVVPMVETIHADRGRLSVISASYPEIPFGNAIEASRITQSAYVEGWKIRNGIPVRHAWNMSQDGSYFDATCELFHEGWQNAFYVTSFEASPTEAISLWTQAENEAFEAELLSFISWKTGEASLRAAELEADDLDSWLEDMPGEEHQAWASWLPVVKPSPNW